MHLEKPWEDGVCLGRCIYLCVCGLQCAKMYAYILTEHVAYTTCLYLYMHKNTYIHLYKNICF